MNKFLFALAGCALTLAACGGGGGGGSGDDSVSSSPASTSTSRTGYYATKTNYQPQQDAKSYEAAPAGFTPVYTELVARHGTRGLSSMKYDDAVLNMWTQAKADGALTALGQKLGPDVEKIMKANFLMGYGVSGISAPGYGNLTQVGVNEHKQLATRLLARLPGLFNGLTARQIEILNSGQDRAVDSSQFFAGSLGSTMPAISALISTPTTNRFQLYFHKLKASTDPVADTSSVNYATLLASLDYQTFAAATDSAGYGAEVLSKIAAAKALPELKLAARAVLSPLFTSEFIDKIDAGTYSFANTSTRSYTSADGLFTNTLTGDGKTKIKTIVEAASLIYELYIIAPGMSNEAAVDFNQYMPLEQAKAFAYLQDIDDFYSKGPSATEFGSLTYKMAGSLQADFFNEVDNIVSGTTSRAARLRFTHAEIMIPFAVSLGIPGAATSIPRAQTYSYDNSTWRGEVNTPMAANVQWDIYKNAAGTVLVKMLFNEKEVDFKPACESARYATGSHFYTYSTLKTCYAPA